FIKKAADFMCDFRDKKTNLPKESYDLWEEKLGVHTFTCSTTYAGLIAAHNFAKLFRIKKDAEKYLKVAKEVKEATIKHLYDSKSKIFLKRIYYDKKKGWLKDKTIDISTFYGLFEYGILDINDPKLESTKNKTLEKLSYKKDGIDALARYENDAYFRTSEKGVGNIWFISTLWLAEYYIEKAEKKQDLIVVKNILDWVVKHSLSSGVLSEQIDPFSGKQVSVAPLIWSHACFVTAITKYLKKIKQLKE
ncbi:MAG: glycoside hydrolase family 15 protein, partial [Minisyncoccales bacterium]